jgi:hypothetical protein
VAERQAQQDIATEWKDAKTARESAGSCEDHTGILRKTLNDGERPAPQLLATRSGVPNSVQCRETKPVHKINGLRPAVVVRPESSLCSHASLEGPSQQFKASEATGPNAEHTQRQGQEAAESTLGTCARAWQSSDIDLESSIDPAPVDHPCWLQPIHS